MFRNINYTTNYFENKLKYHKNKLSYIFVKKKYIVDAINTLYKLQISFKSIRFTKQISELIPLIIKKLRKNNTYNKILKSSDKFINFVLYYVKSISTRDENENILKIIIPTKYNSDFDKYYKFQIINILGNIIENSSNKRIYKNYKLIKHVLKIIKKANFEDLDHCTTYLSSFYNYNRGDRLISKYDYVMIKYLRNINKIQNQDKIIIWLELLDQLINKNNKIYFFENSGYEILQNIKEKFPNSSFIRTNINIMNYRIIRYCKYKTTSLHQLTKYNNTVSATEFIILNSNIDYNLLDSNSNSILYSSIINNNKKLIDFYISSGFIIDNKTNKLLQKRLNKKYYKSDPLFLNIVQLSFVKRKINDKFINEEINKYGFYNDINIVIKQYVDPICEYIKNKNKINQYLIDNKFNLYNISLA